MSPMLVVSCLVVHYLISEIKRLHPLKVILWLPLPWGCIVNFGEIPATWQLRVVFVPTGTLEQRYWQHREITQIGLNSSVGRAIAGAAGDSVLPFGELYKLLLIAPSFESSSFSSCCFPIIGGTESPADQYPWDNGTLLQRFKSCSSQFFFVQPQILHSTMTCKYYLQPKACPWSCRQLAMS